MYLCVKCQFAAFAHKSTNFEHPLGLFMKIFLRISWIVLSIITGALFLYSAYTKLFPIQAFEYTLTDQAHLPHIVAAITSRFFIGVEFGLGSLILLHLFGKSKWVLKSAFALLVIFSVYLVWLWATAGDKGNCGCFGDTIWMSPSTSLVKNALLLLIIGLLIRYHNGFTYNWVRIAAPTALICAIASAYIFFPIFSRYKIDLNALYTTDKKFAPAADLTKGKYIIAFLSQSCSHCRKAALKMHELKQRNPNIPFYLIIGGTTSDLTDFWKASQAQDLPYTRLAQDPFMKYTHGLFPTILWVNNSMVEADTGYPELTLPVIEKWMATVGN